MLYSSFEEKEDNKKLPWYEELTLTGKQKIFLKKLLRLEPVYESISEIETDFIDAYSV